MQLKSLFVLTETNITLFYVNGHSICLPYTPKQKPMIMKHIANNKFGKLLEFLQEPEKDDSCVIKEKYKLETSGFKDIDGIIDFLTAQKEANLPIDYLHSFVNLLKENPTPDSITQSFNFIKNKGIKITENGYVVGLRAVNSEYKDKHTKTIWNKPQTFVSMDRDSVTHNPASGCSRGLHVGNYSYVNGFASSDDHIQVVLVHPKDIVSVPYECNGEKMRVCNYYILRDATDEDLKLFQDNNHLCFPESIVLDFDNKKVISKQIIEESNTLSIKTKTIKKDNKTYKKECKKSVKTNKPLPSKNKELTELIVEPKSGGRLSVKSMFVKSLGANPGDILHVSVGSQTIRISKNKQQGKFEQMSHNYVVDKDYMIRLGHMLLSPLKAKKYKMNTDGKEITITKA